MRFSCMRTKRSMSLSVACECTRGISHLAVVPPAWMVDALNTGHVIINHAHTRLQTPWPSLSSFLFLFLFLCTHIHCRTCTHRFITTWKWLTKRKNNYIMALWRNTFWFLILLCNKICKNRGREKKKEGKQRLPREPLDLFMLLNTWHSVTLLPLRLYIPWPHPRNNKIISSNENKYVTPLLVFAAE